MDDVAYISDEIHENMKTSRVYPGDVLLNITGASIGRCCIVPANILEANVNQHVCIVRPNKRLGAKFLHAYLASDKGQTQIFSGEKGISREGLNFEELKSFDVIVPPLPEQTAIAAYLDRKTAQIDTLIERKRRLITLLQEERTAVISQAVTKGLAGLKIDWRSLQDCASLPPGYKDSGIEWIGAVPAGWRVAVLKFVAEIQSGLTLGNKYEGIETVTRPYLRVANVQDGYLDLETITTIDLPIAKVARYELQPGDVLMTEGGDFDKLGRGYVWEGQIEGCLHQNHVFAVRPNFNLIRSRFMAALTTSFHGKNYFTRSSQQTTNLATINQTTLGQFPLMLPPLEEQDAILDFLDQKTAQIDQSIARTERQIDLLQEYRTALISAVVTGKVDVREE